MRSTLRRAAAAALLLALLPVTSASAAVSDGLGIRLVDAPVARKDDPRAQTYIVDQVRPGDAFSRRFEVSNGTTAPMTLELYPAAADVQDGGWAVADGRASNELTDWMSVTPSSVTLAPGEASVATVTVDVPSGAPTGERYAAVLAELPAVAAPTDNVALASRVGIRVYLSVGAGGEPASDFEVSTLTPRRLEDGTPAVTAQVTNTGGRALDLSGDLELTDGPGGLRAGPFPVDVRTLGIDATGDVSVALDDALPAGPWRARLMMRSGRIEKAVEATITFPAAGEVGPRVTAEPVPLAQDPSVVIPVAIGLLVLAFLLLLWALWRRRRKDRDVAEEPTTAPVVPQARRSADESVRS